MNHDDGADLGGNLVLEFAQAAAHSGWTQAALDGFRARLDPGAATSPGLPPNVRDVAHAFNALADIRTKSWIGLCATHRLSDILIQRFADNEQYKASVIQLAKSDLFHPLDTLARTAQTAAIMLGVLDGPASRVRRCWLVLLYSTCVLIWMADRPPYRTLHRVCHIAARFAGAD